MCVHPFKPINPAPGSRANVRHPSPNVGTYDPVAPRVAIHAATTPHTVMSIPLGCCRTSLSAVTNPPPPPRSTRTQAQNHVPSNTTTCPMSAWPTTWVGTRSSTRSHRWACSSHGSGACGLCLCTAFVTCCRDTDTIRKLPLRHPSTAGGAATANQAAPSGARGPPFPEERGAPVRHPVPPPATPLVRAGT